LLFTVRQLFMQSPALLFCTYMPGSAPHRTTVAPAACDKKSYAQRSDFIAQERTVRVAAPPRRYGRDEHALDGTFMLTDAHRLVGEFEARAQAVRSRRRRSGHAVAAFSLVADAAMLVSPFGRFSPRIFLPTPGAPCRRCRCRARSIRRVMFYAICHTRATRRHCRHAEVLYMRM